MLKPNTRLSNTFKTIGTPIHVGTVKNETDSQSVKAKQEGMLIPADPADRVAGLHGEAVYRFAKSTLGKEMVGSGQEEILLKRPLATDTDIIDAVLVRVSGYSADPDATSSPSGTYAYGLPNTKQVFMAAGSGVEVYLPIDTTLAVTTEVKMSQKITYNVATRSFGIAAPAIGILETPFIWRNTIVEGTRPMADNDTNLPVTYDACYAGLFKL